MNGRNSSKKQISFQEVKSETPNRTYYITNNIRRLTHFFKRSMGELYQSLWCTLSIDQIDFSTFKDAIWPAATSAAAILIGDMATTRMSRVYADNDDYQFIFQFMLGTAILAFSSAHCVTEKRSKTSGKFYAEIALDSLSVVSLYTSTFQGSRLILEGQLSNSYSLVASLGVSTFLIPGTLAHLALKLQQFQLKRKYARGAQRSDTALISCGMSPISNTYFQANYFLTSEILSVSRMFQLSLISDNILNTTKLIQQFRNFPALVADAGPPIIKKMIAQRAKIKKDYQFNNTEQTVLKFTNSGPKFFKIPRHKLLKGDFVVCDNDFDKHSSPVSGELFAFKKDSEDRFTRDLEVKKFSVNLKAHNGEDVAIEHYSNPHFTTVGNKIDLHDISKKRQAGILTGATLDLFEEKNFVVRIQETKERPQHNHYEKTSVINQIINEHKRQCVIQAMICSVLLASWLKRKDFTEIPFEAIRLVFNVFQMQIPFSETFLREMVNSRLMKDINRNLPYDQIQTIDALRIMDFCNAMGGYYAERFPQGVAIVSDKTGTLTTSQMNVLGFWTPEMKPDVQRLLADGKSVLVPEKSKQDTCFEIFASAYTHSKKELELEEFAILELFKKVLGKENLLEIKKSGSNHLTKMLFGRKKIETFHLGLYKNFGGRFTLVSEGEQNYLVFCGIPRGPAFHETPLIKSYASMQMRQRVLSRDWCIARTHLSNEQFQIVKDLFIKEDTLQIERFISSQKDLLHNFTHYCTFIIDNPVKPGAEHFISKAQSVNVPVFVATGDNANAAENIAKVLCPNNSKSIIKISTTEKFEFKVQDIPQQAIVIFAGLNDHSLRLFQQLMDKKPCERPSIIFSEMSTQDKGRLVTHLKRNGFFVVANGDGTNDVDMMKKADVVIAHLTENGTYATGVEQFANLNDRQLQQMFNSKQSFYNLFDIDQPRSEFRKAFEPLANSQEKVSLSLIGKGIKMAWELMNAIGIPVKQMPFQHWFSILFDFGWFGVTFNTILGTQEGPADNQNLSVSNLPFKLMLGTLALSIAQAWAMQATLEEATNENVMMLTLLFLHPILNCLYSAFGHVRDRIQLIDNPAPPEEAKLVIKTNKKPGLFNGCLRKRAPKYLGDSVVQIQTRGAGPGA